MTIEFLIYPALVFLAVALTVKFIERRRDVLYGPYIEGRKTAFTRRRNRFHAVMAAMALRREYGRLAVRFATIGIFASAIIG